MLWGATQRIGPRNLYLQATFLDGQEDGANVQVEFSWEHGSRNGFALRMRFDGEAVLPVAKGRIIGHPYWPDILRNTVMEAYEDAESWEGVLTSIIQGPGEPGY